MAGVWSTATLDLVIPSTGLLEPGSGSLYIGGPRLPDVLTDAGINDGFVWYTDEDGFDAGYDYWFLAHQRATGDYLEALVIGFKKTADATVTIIWSSTIYTDPAYEQNIWNTSHTLQNIDGIPHDVYIDWRWTADYLLDVRFYILSTGAAPGVGSPFVTFDLPAGFPFVDVVASGTNRGPSLVCMGETAPGGLNYTSMMLRLDGTVATLFTADNPNLCVGFEGGGTFTLAKPS